MTWNIEFLEEAKKDLKKLDHSVQLQVVKGIEKVRKNPLLPAQSRKQSHLSRYQEGRASRSNN